METIHQVPISGTSLFLEVDTRDIDDFNMARVIDKGFMETLGKRGKDKAGKKEQHASIEAYEQARLEIAKEQLETMKAGKYRWVGGGKAKKADSGLKQEMLRHAKLRARSMVSAAGHKVSKVSMKDITRIAEALISADAETYRKAAEASLAAAATPVQDTGVDLTQFLTGATKKVARKGVDNMAKARDAKAKPTIVPPPVKAKPGAHLRQ